MAVASAVGCNSTVYVLRAVIENVESLRGFDSQLLLHLNIEILK